MPQTRYYTYPRLEGLGRLGNQLWQIASTIGFADMDQGIARFKRNWEYRPYFSVPDEFFEPVPKEAQDPSVLNKDDYLQQLHYWQHMKGTILSYFQPSDGIKEELYSRWLSVIGVHGDPPHTTALHVRRGDYLKYPDLFPACTMAYYDRAKELIRENNPGTNVVVFSDDIAWCRQNFDQDHLFVDGVARPVEVAHRRRSRPMDFWDLFMMTLCDSHIISNSSFSWWGAYLADKGDVYYPSVWYGGEFTKIPWKGMIPRGWTEVPV